MGPSLRNSFAAALLAATASSACSQSSPSIGKLTPSADASLGLGGSSGAPSGLDGHARSPHCVAPGAQCASTGEHCCPGYSCKTVTPQDCVGPFCSTPSYCIPEGVGACNLSDCPSACCDPFGDAGAWVCTDHHDPPPPTTDGTCSSACDGACSSGRCLTTLLSSSALRGFAVDDDSVYFLTADTASGTYSVAKEATAGGAVTTLATRRGSPTGLAVIAVDASGIFWGETAPSEAGTVSSILKMPLAGGAPVVVASNILEPAKLVLDPANVYWFADAVHWVSKSGGTPVTVAPDAMDAGVLASAVAGLAVFGDNVYFTRLNILGGAVASVPIAGGPLTTVVPGLSQPRDIVAFASSVYFIEIRRRALMQAPLTGGPPTTVSSNDPVTFDDLASDGLNVYWIEGQSNQHIMSVPAGGGSPITLAPSPPATLRYLGVNASSLFFLSQDACGASVMKLTLK